MTCRHCNDGELVEILEAKSSVALEWRDLLKARSIRQAEEIGRQANLITHLEGLVAGLIEGKFNSTSDVMANLLPPHPEKLDAEWKQPALRPTWALQGHIAMFVTRQEAEDVAAAYHGGEPVRMFGLWGTRLGERAPDEDPQFWAQLFVMANPEYRPGRAPGPVTDDH